MLFQHLLAPLPLFLLSFVNASPSFNRVHGQNFDPCPVQCGLAGPNPQDWTLFHSLKRVKQCDRTMMMDFLVDSSLDKEDASPRIRACSVWGDDFTSLTPVATTNSDLIASNVTVERSWFNGADGLVEDAADAVSETQEYLQNTASNDSAVIFATSGEATVGFYGGAKIDSQKLASSVIRDLVKEIRVNGIKQGLLVQLCGEDRNAHTTWGMMVATNSSLTAVQSAVKSWSSGECVAGASGSVSLPESTIYTVESEEIPSANGTSTHAHGRRHSKLSHKLHRRADCRTITVIGGDDCGSLAKRCGITGAQFNSFNTASNLCSSLKPGQRVCCSAGTIPNLKPKQNADGSCATYTVKKDDDCSKIGAYYGLTQANLETFNKKTWGWSGCDDLWRDITMCLSSGTPPMPNPVANAICGPQVPGTQAPASGVDLATLNPCPLKACCNIWGQCGITRDYCTKSQSASGAPGTAAPKQNGCISNCGTEIVKSGAPASLRNIAYFEGYNLGSRDCLHMDITQVDTTKHTHIHYGFGTLTPDYDVKVGDALAQFEFKQFKALKGVKRILSIGGWDFSTHPSTYMIFRNGVKQENRAKMAEKIANFVIDNDLDGVDIDWEYPAAPDIPDIPPADKNEGTLYTLFLFELKGRLKNKSLSIAAPASYWYLKGFPIDSISLLVDYIVYMTYDLHGQWDFENKWASPGCEDGNCLRSHVNFTETVDALTMITKAGVPSNKIAVGVSSYGRSFQMTTPGCTGPDCRFTGKSSGATKGRCTDTGGYLGNGEIKEIISKNTKRAGVQDFMDDSYSNIMVYNGNQWVSYMDDTNKKNRGIIYQSLQMGGTVDWTVSLDEFKDCPAVYTENGLSAWDTFKLNIKRNQSPYINIQPSGEWTKKDCNNKYVEDALKYPSSERWKGLGCEDALSDALGAWRKKPKNDYSLFSEFISNTYHGRENMDCGSMKEQTQCETAYQCDDMKGVDTGPAAYLVMNSLVEVHNMFKNHHAAVTSAAGLITGEWKKFANTFAPLPDGAMAFNLLIDFMSLGIPLVMNPFFNTYLKSVTTLSTTADNIKDIANVVVSSGASIIKDSSPEDYGWTAESQDNFIAQMSKIFTAWTVAIEKLSAFYFSGKEDGIKALTQVISGGKLVAGKREFAVGEEMKESALRHSIERAFYGFVIPKIWKSSGTNAFVIDTGYDCGTKDPISSYVLPADGGKTYVCYKPTNKMYYLMHPSGAASTCGNGLPDPNGGDAICNKLHFSVPPGVSQLSSDAHGGVTLEDLVYSAVNSYKKNGNKNGWKTSDMVDPKNLESLMEQNIRAAGFSSLPVCSASEAWKNWDGKKKTDNYPCN